MTIRHYSKQALEAVARRILCAYHGHYLYLAPQPVPIEQIIEQAASHKSVRVRRLGLDNSRAQ